MLVFDLEKTAEGIVVAFVEEVVLLLITCQDPRDNDDW
jgi:hypothetical protein